MNVELFVCAVVAMLSPLGVAATLAIIPSGRVKALVFGLGLLSGQLLACGILVLVGAALTLERERHHAVLRNAVELALGVALLGLAAFTHSRTDDSWTASARRSAALLDRLRRVRVATAAGAGVLLGIGGPKRLVLTALAAASITASGAKGSHAVILVFAYALIATLLVWAPILVFEIVGDRITTALRAAERWLVRHERLLAFYSFLTLGSFAVVDSLVGLL